LVLLGIYIYDYYALLKVPPAAARVAMLVALEDEKVPVQLPLVSGIGDVAIAPVRAVHDGVGFDIALQRSQYRVIWTDR
jgi:hypothetical protein